MSSWTTSSWASLDSKLKDEPRQGTRTLRLTRLRDREERQHTAEEATDFEEAPQADIKAGEACVADFKARERRA